MSLIDCPRCGLPAQIVDRFALKGTSGPVEHVKMRCVAGHVLTLLVEHLAGSGCALGPSVTGRGASSVRPQCFTYAGEVPEAASSRESSGPDRCARCASPSRRLLKVV
jgi:hypothetical protein